MSDTAKQILDLAEALMLERGFNGFSYQHISSALGMKNAAIHYHYPSKTDLGVALVARYRRRFQRAVAQLDATAQDPWVKLEWYFDVLSELYGNTERLCPTGMLSAELATLPEPMRQAANEFVAELYDWCVRVLKDGVQSGHFRFAGACEDKAAMLLATLQGALQLARFQPDWLDAIKKQARLDLGAR